MQRSQSAETSPETIQMVESPEKNINTDSITDFHTFKS